MRRSLPRMSGNVEVVDPLGREKALEIAADDFTRAVAVAEQDDAARAQAADQRFFLAAVEDAEPPGGDDVGIEQGIQLDFIVFALDDDRQGNFQLAAHLAASQTSARRRP